MMQKVPKDVQCRKQRLELESFYSITTFIGGMSPPLQIRQVAQLTEHYMQPARIKPHAKEHTQPRPET